MNKNNNTKASNPHESQPLPQEKVCCRFLQDATALKRLLTNDLSDLASAFEEALSCMVTALKSGNKILAMGNGGSAADAEHLVCELIGRFNYDRSPLPAVSLTCPTPAFTAISNDYGLEDVFARQITGLGRAGDVVVAISTSGKSLNVLRAAETARKLGLKIIALTGSSPSPLSAIADITLKAPSTQTPRIQEIHGLLIHSLCRGIEEELFPPAAGQNILSLPHKKLVPPSEIDNLAAATKAFCTVFTNGCFDILHPGHVALLKAARSYGDMLIVGLNSDESVQRLKGKNRPYHKFEDRAAVLAALEPVDFIIGFDEDTPLELIKRLTPKILVKGGDYDRSSIIGADWVESHGGTVKIFPLVGNHSTTRILQNHERKHE